MAAVGVCHPFDVVRTKMQAGNLTVSAAVGASFKQQGLPALYQGFAVPFVAQAVYKSVIFCTNTLSRQHLFPGDSSSRALFLSGMLAGSVNATIVAPVELVRTHQILSSSSGAAPSLLEVVGRLRGQFGGKVLWAGLWPAVLRDGPGVGFYLLAFEEMKRKLHGDSLQPVPLWIRVAAGSLAGIAFWTWAIPIDTVKTLIESAYAAGSSSGSTGVGKVLAQTNLRMMYRALPLAYMRGVPSAAVTLTTYDLAADFLTRRPARSIS